VPLGWLREHVHQLGCLYTPAELVKHATGKPFDSSDFIKYLNDKFTLIYG